MKTILATLLMSIGLSLTGLTARAAELFSENEKSLSFFGSYVDKVDGKVAPGASFSYFFTKHLGVSAITYWENYEGTFFDNISGEGIFRLPLGDMPLAPYGLIGIGYSFDTEETFEYLGAGAEWRFSEKWGAFGDVRWQWNNDTRDGVGVRVGVRWVF